MTEKFIVLVKNPNGEPLSKYRKSFTNFIDAQKYFASFIENENTTQIDNELWVHGISGYDHLVVDLYEYLPIHKMYHPLATKYCISMLKNTLSTG